MQRLERRLGIQSEFLAEHRAGLLVDAERVGLPPGPVQGHHELAAEMLSEGMGGHQGLELTEHLVVATQSEFGLDAVFERGQPQLFQARDLGLDELAVGEILQGRPAPQAECLTKQTGDSGRVVPEQVSGLGEDALELDGVHLVGVNRQGVAGRPGDQQIPAVRAQRLPQSGHYRLEGVGGVAGNLIAPQQVDEVVGRHRLAGAQEQRGEQGPLPGPGDPDRLSLLEDLERSEDPELHPATVPPGLGRLKRQGPVRPASATHPMLPTTVGPDGGW